MGLTVLDAGVLIGFLDSNDHHHQAARRTLSELIEQRRQIALPASALAEALVGPSRRTDEAAALVREVVERLPLEIAPLDENVAVEAARLRAAHRSLRLPDAVVIATAVTLDADRLVTTDRGWPARGRLGLRAELSVI